MAGRTVAVPADSAPAGYFFLGPHVIVDGVDCVEVADYSPSAADRQWIARNLGDVPMRIIDTWRPSVTTITPISAESLGRES